MKKIIKAYAVYDNALERIVIFGRAQSFAVHYDERHTRENMDNLLFATDEKSSKPEIISVEIHIPALKKKKNPRKQ